jgi:tripartite-type tricarboxylate transporter receptor subunit TctC
MKGLWDAAKAAFAGAALLAAASAGAQQYPSRPVTMIVPFPAGGPTDVVARALVPLMEQQWKQNFIVEFRPGAGSILGTDYVARAKPDGYTLLLNSNGVYTAKIFIKNITYDPADLRPVVELCGANFLIMTNAQVPAKTLGELIAYAKSKGSAMNAGTVPNNASQLDLEVLKLRAGMSYTVVPYNGLADIITAALRNDVQLFLGVPQSVASLTADGKLRALASASPARNEHFPDVPTTREAGLDFQSGFSFGVWAPARTPADVVARISADMEKAVLSPDYSTRMKNLNYDVPQQPSAYPATIDRQAREYFDVARKVGIEAH